MAFSEKDFTSCIINPLQRQLLAKNPKLNALVPTIQEEVEDEMLGDDVYILPKVFSPIEIENLFRYVILVFDPQSLLVKSEKDLNRRKEQAAELAGLNEDEQYLESVFTSRHPLVVPLAVGYLMTYAKSKEWAAICAFESTFWESITKLMEPISGKDSKAQLESVEKKAKIKSEVDADIIRLEQYYYKFLGEDKNLEEKAKPKMTPEGMAKMFN